MRIRNFNLCKGFITLFTLVFFPLLCFGQIYTKEDIEKIRYEIDNLNDTVAKLQSELVKIQTSNSPVVNNIRIQDDLIKSKKNIYDQLKKTSASSIADLQNKIKQLEGDSVRVLIEIRKSNDTSTTLKDQNSKIKNEIDILKSDSTNNQVNLYLLRKKIDDNKRNLELKKDSLEKDNDIKRNYLYEMYKNRLVSLNSDSSLSSINYDDFIKFRNTLVQLQLNNNLLALPEQFIQYQSLIYGVKKLLNEPLPLNCSLLSQKSLDITSFLQKYKSNELQIFVVTKYQNLLNNYQSKINSISSWFTTNTRIINNWESPLGANKAQISADINKKQNDAEDYPAIVAELARFLYLRNTRLDKNDISTHKFKCIN
ncbi:MAG: hypothetical protein ACOYLT_05200 [Flavobacterium sp.]|uniref:hypothetical protein n=1 Tax=Flavobacterium sp. TaxID=239 RepID=UPI003BDA0441